jgi:hypothetical protein
MDWILLAHVRDLWTLQWTFGFHKILGNFWVAEQLAASQEGLSSIQLVNLFTSHVLKVVPNNLSWVVQTSQWGLEWRVSIRTGGNLEFCVFDARGCKPSPSWGLLINRLENLDVTSTRSAL